MRSGLANWCSNVCSHVYCWSPPEEAWWSLPVCQTHSVSSLDLVLPEREPEHGFSKWSFKGIEFTSSTSDPPFLKGTKYLGIEKNESLDLIVFIKKQIFTSIRSRKTRRQIMLSSSPIYCLFTVACETDDRLDILHLVQDAERCFYLWHFLCAHLHSI